MLDSAHIAASSPSRDIETAIGFYQGKLGLRLDRRRDALPQNREAELSAGSGSLLTRASAPARASTRLPASTVCDLDSVVRRSGSAASSSRSTTCPM